eukprot:7692210-Lingulodinium_polyedra.AAC.1
MIYIRALGTAGRAWIRRHADHHRAAQARGVAVPQPAARQWTAPPTVVPRPVLREWLHQWAQNHA